MVKSDFRKRRKTYVVGHATNCPLRPNGKKPDQAVLVPKKRHELMLRQMALSFAETDTTFKPADRPIPNRAKLLVEAGVADLLPVSAEFSHLTGYERAYQRCIEGTIETNEFLRNFRQDLLLVPCEQCGQELSLWEWWEAIEGEDTEAAPIRGCFSTEQDAEQFVAKLKAETESHSRYVIERNILDLQRD